MSFEHLSANQPGLFAEPESAGPSPAPRVKSARSANRAAWWKQDLGRTATYLMGQARRRRLAGSRTIIEPASKQLILVGQVEMTPLHAGGADIGAGDHRPAVGKVGPDAIIVERRFHTLPHHQDLDAELHRLLPGPLG